MVGYHANYLEECEDFVSRGVLIISDDADFLGLGMYFWERKTTAQWWKNTKKTERAAGIVRAEIDINKTLDLTDNQTFEKLEKIYNLIDDAIKSKYQKKARKIGKILDNALGFKIDIIYDGYPGVLPQVLRARQKAKGPKTNSFVYNAMLEVGYEDYYCLRPDSDGIITNRAWVEK